MNDQQSTITRALDDHHHGIVKMTPEEHAAALAQLEALQAEAERMAAALLQERGDAARDELRRRVAVYVAAATAAADALASVAGMEQAIRAATGGADAQIGFAAFCAPMPAHAGNIPAAHIKVAALAASIAAEASNARREWFALP